MNTNIPWKNKVCVGYLHRSDAISDAPGMTNNCELCFVQTKEALFVLQRPLYSVTWPVDLTFAMNAFKSRQHLQHCQEPHHHCG